MPTVSWSTLVAPAAALAGAFGGVILSHVLVRGRDEQQWQRQRDQERRETLAALYVDLLVYAFEQMSFLEGIDNTYARGYHPNPGVQHQDVLTARVYLYASEPIQAAWRRVIGALEDVMLVHGQAGDYPRGVGEHAQVALSELIPLLQQVFDHGQGTSPTALTCRLCAWPLDEPLPPGDRKLYGAIVAYTAQHQRWPLGHPGRRHPLAGTSRIRPRRPPANSSKE
jgi:hypothetical protein